MTFWYELVAVSILFLVVCAIADTHFGSIGSRWKRLELRVKFRWCTVVGHKWSDLTTGILSACDRCCRTWPIKCRHCGEPVHIVDHRVVSRGGKGRCWGTFYSHEL